MKTSTVLIAFVAALVGGVAGALLVVALGESSAPAPESGQIAADFDDAALRDSDRRNAEDIQKALGRLGQLELRLGKAETERDALKKTNTELKQEVTTLKNAPTPEPGAANGNGTGTVDINERVDEAVDKALKVEREKQAADEKAAGLKRVDKKMQAATDAAAKKLEAQLGLTRAQTDQITRVFDNMNQRVMQLTEEASTAKESGQDFDWGTRWDELMTETEGAIRNELSSAQLNTFDEALGDNGLTGILWPGK